MPYLPHILLPRENRPDKGRAKAYRDITSDDIFVTAAFQDAS
jgi:hypothetical protein